MEKCEKTIFGPANAVHSTHLLVQIYNTYFRKYASLNVLSLKPVVLYQHTKNVHDQHSFL